MANNELQLFSVQLTDPDSNKMYRIIVTDAEFKILGRDATFASFKLHETKYLQYSQFMNADAEQVAEGTELNLDDDGSIDEPVRNRSEDSAFKWPHEDILLLLHEFQK